MITVHKYILPQAAVFDLLLPSGATILHLAEQYGETCLWARVDTEQTTERRSFAWAGTGHPCHPEEIHRGTLVRAGGALVMHLFEKPQ